MNEQMLRDFAERAEAQVRMPDLADLESRGRDLRRVRRVVVAVVALAAILAGGMVASVVGDDRVAEPVDTPDPAIELDSPSGAAEELAAARTYTVRPAPLIDESKMEVRAEFTVPGAGWLWRDDVAVKLSGPGTDLSSLPREPYAEVGIMLADRFLGAGPAGVGGGLDSQCRSDTPWTEFAATPLAAAGQIAGVQGVTMLTRPREAVRSGHPAAHVRLRVPRLCPQFNDILLWSRAPASGGNEPGVGVVLYAGQVLDVWVVDVEGTFVVLHTEVSPGLPRGYGDEARVILDSIELEPVRD